MSRSYKKAIFKDSGIGRKAYHRIVRRHNGTILKTKIKHNILLDNTEIEIELKDAKTIESYGKSGDSIRKRIAHQWLKE